MAKSFLKKDYKDRSILDREIAPKPSQLQELVGLFPIGEQMSYYPEYQKDITFETIILAYCVNNQFIYSREDIDFSADQKTLAFHLGGRKIPATEVETFRLVVPDTRDMYRNLDYIRKAALDQGQFRRGNSISLIYSGANRGEHHLDTAVHKRMAFKDGYYTGHTVVLLNPEYKSITFVDKRRTSRLHPHLPVLLHIAGTGRSHPCMLEDYSERYACLSFEGDDAILDSLEQDDVVGLTLSLGQSEKEYKLRGTIFRKKPVSIVVKLKEILKGADFLPLEMLDILHLKANLLHCSNKK